MKILFITHYTELYGANKSLIDLIEGLHDKVESVVLSPKEGQLTELLAKKRIPFIIQDFEAGIYIRKYGFLKIPFKVIQNVQATLALNKKLEMGSLDIIYSNSSVINLGFLLSIYYNKPHIIHVREFGSLHYKSKFDFGMRGFHHMLSKAAAIIAVSASISNTILGKVKENTHIIYNGVISEADLQKSPKNLNEKLIKFGIVGILSRSKNFIEAIKAFKIFNNYNPNSKLIIVGGGSDSEYIALLKAECGDLINQRKVVFTGYIESIDEIFVEIDILLMCSRNEAMGRVTVEAMARAIPVIGYNEGGTSEIIDDNCNGLLYEGDHVSLSEKMIYLTNNPLIYHRFSINCLEIAKQKYTIEKYASKIYQILKSVVCA